MPDQDMKNPSSHEFFEARYLDNSELGSGVGSKGTWRQRKLDIVSQLCRRHQVRKILDLGCGDLQVVGQMPDLEQFEYVGVDFSQRIIERNQQRFPKLKFIAADLHDIAQLGLETPDLVICFDVLFHIQDDVTYERVCDFMFNCGARAVALTCAVGHEESNGVNLWYRDFWKHSERLQLGYTHKIERPFRLPYERIVSFDLCEPSSRNDMTEVVYICSPNREQQLFTSLGTVIRSASSFDRVVIFCVGHRPPNWRFADPRIIVKEVPPLFGSYFYGNKTYLCTRKSRRVVFLDTDTVVLRPLDLLWQGKDADLIARVGQAFDHPTWKNNVWQETLHHCRAEDVPMFNAGVLVFQNGAHQKIHADWKGFIAQYLSGDLHAPFDDGRMPEQWALALAVGKSRLQYSYLQPSEHAYGWIAEPGAEDVVFHTGNELFNEQILKLGFDAAPMPSVFSHDGGEATIDTASQTLAALGNLVRSQELELAQLRESRSFTAGALLVSAVRFASALCRFDRRAIRQEWQTVRRSVSNLAS